MLGNSDTGPSLQRMLMMAFIGIVEVLCLKLFITIQGRTNNWLLESALLKEKQQIFERFSYIEKEFEDIKSTVLEVNLRTKSQV